MSSNKYGIDINKNDTSYIFFWKTTIYTIRLLYTKVHMLDTLILHCSSNDLLVFKNGTGYDYTVMKSSDFFQKSDATSSFSLVSIYLLKASCIYSLFDDANSTISNLTSGAWKLLCTKQ